MQVEATVSDAYSLRLQRRKTSALANIWTLLDQVCDPEIPVLSLWDLGILSDIEKAGEQLIITITPTYSGCPAMDVIRSDIAALLQSSGIGDYKIISRLSPAWSTDWLSPEGQTKLVDYGIAAPGSCNACQGGLAKNVPCPLCGSDNTRLSSEFGSTACKALYQCQNCQEPFDYFKPI